ncbi:hypothetical protein Ae168Ps1_6254c [Pseudonocardia sp. Ae168_Ps1]|uniref:hypothetical protein n=1 Tax=unclassified Pseudonocardia TaxID=2619320 RepID=UPI00094B0972|nr:MULTISPECIES: hypothetical protein [unclassified Pseudonocardia]OLL70507.1 hypothetical protein Ae168Ps1_6254c [Pseudonocardia sp. Ae168_Ps1]OLL71528.1 hypothetical protein Ae263Ps1_6016c [Pseudonocardia sp. Ae263_Ps1]
MSVSNAIIDSLAQIHLLPAQDIPNPGPKVPPGAQAIQDVVGYLIWVAGICVLGLFFGGIVASTAGRMWDHHGSGRTDARMIVSSLALAVLFGLGYTLVTQFAGGTS